MKKISVIVPIYKVEKYLDKCVESIVNQTYKNLELILVDDGSPDNCPKMCDEWAKKDNRIKVIHKENGGLSDARNFGIEAATGDYLMFVDSDDYIDELMCEKLVTLLEANNADFAMCKAQKFYENKPIELDNEEISIKIFQDEEVLEELYKMEIEYLMISCAKLYKTKIFSNIRYPKGKLHEDEFIIHEIMHKTKCFVVSNEPLYYYLQRATSIMGTRGEKSIKNKFEAYRSRYDFFNEKYSKNTEKNNVWYLKMLRVLICTMPNQYKELSSEIWQEYKMIYDQCTTTSKKDKIFRKLKFLYKMLYNIRLKF